MGLGALLIFIYFSFLCIGFVVFFQSRFCIYLGEAMLLEILWRRRRHLTALLFLRAVTLYIFNVVCAWLLMILLTGLYCCDRAEDYACQTACKRILMSMKTELEIVDGLIEGCKTMPLPQDPLWQCFLESSRSVHPGVTVHPPPSTGLDGAKLHCCSKANSSTCRSVPL